MIEIGREVVCPSGRRGVVRSIRAEVVYESGDTLLIDPALLMPVDLSVDEARALVAEYEASR